MELRERIRVKLHNSEEEKDALIDNSKEPLIERPVLNEISFSVGPGELVVVIGPVGCGKSTLLSTLLGETSLVKGQVRSRGTFALVEQEPSVFSKTVRENILFGKQEDPRRLAEVLRVCELEADLAQLQCGLDTLVGEGGLNISGGQRARLALALACYSDSDCYLLDDLLSAVDAKVARSLLSNCIRGYLRDRAIVLVTHQLNILPEATRILVLDRYGYPSFYGTPEAF